MNAEIKRKFACVLSITSFRIHFVNNNNFIEHKNRNEFNDFNDIEKLNFFLDKFDNIFNDEIAKNCKINLWRQDYFPFLDLNIEDPNKTEKNT